MFTFKDLSIVKQRRRALLAAFDIKASFEEIEETCVPSYAHPNLAAAGVAWMRPIIAAKLWHRWAPPTQASGPVLDFGAASGELHHFLNGAPAYHFVEAEETLATALKGFIPNAERHGLKDLKDGQFAGIFCLDSLEHNDDFAELLGQLATKIKPGGVMILSGPTENALYRLGRKIAGFDGHYHTTTIHHIEQVAAQHMTLLERRRAPFGVPLFSISAWRKA